MERTDANYDIDAQYYDWTYSDADDVPFYIDAAKRYGGPVLELMCGTGRLMVPLARAGNEVVGLDTHDGMLKLAREKIASEPLEVGKRLELRRMDIRNFELGGRFKLVIVPFNSLPHIIKPDDLDDAMRCIARHLDPSGAVIIAVRNMKTPSTAHGEQLDKTGEIPSGRVWRYSTVTCDIERPLVHVNFRYELQSSDGSVRKNESRFDMRVFQPNQLKALLEGAGLAVTGSLGGHNGEILTPKSDWIILTARSRAGLKDRIAMQHQV